MGYRDLWRQLIPTGHWAEDDPVLNAFYAALAQQADNLIAAIHAGATYLSPASCDADGLARWETLLGLGSDGDLATRRARVQARLVGYGTIRKPVLEAIATAFGASALVEELPAQYKFVVHLTSPLGVPPYDAEMRAVYDEVKRATWQYDITYTFNTWGAWKGHTWGQLTAAGLTWGQLKTVNPATI